MQELTQQAQQTLGRELGNSGTVDRGLALALRNPAAAALYGIPAAAATGLIYAILLVEVLVAAQSNCQAYLQDQQHQL